MEAVNYSNFRKNLKSYMKKINENSEAIIVTSIDDTDIVAISKDDYDNIIENLYLLFNDANREHLKKSIEELEKGEYVKVSLEDL
ncbi:MAG: hypothetical protein GXY89_07510 [Tissierellia bacterium]|jgi:antitoxin YefM|nr:hypothetical protein [Tissierellia bacterium]